MNEHDYEKSMGLLALAEKAMTEDKADIAHICLLEALSLLQVHTEKPNYNYFETED
jgi:hypothetical protein